MTKQIRAKLAHTILNECDLDGGPHNTFEGVDEDACSLKRFSFSFPSHP
jgi:hypothetical protein